MNYETWLYKVGGYLILWTVDSGCGRIMKMDGMVKHGLHMDGVYEKSVLYYVDRESVILSMARNNRKKFENKQIWSGL